MKRKLSRPIILTFPAPEPAPRILPFPRRAKSTSAKSGPPTQDEAAAASDSSELREVRERLFRMIVANQWDRSHGNRAS